MTKKLKKNEWWACYLSGPDRKVIYLDKTKPGKRAVCLWLSAGYKLVKVRIVEVEE